MNLFRRLREVEMASRHRKDLRDMGVSEGAEEQDTVAELDESNDTACTATSLLLPLS